MRLTQSQADQLSSDLKDDAKDLYFKGLLSLFEALKSVETKLFSWATVKIYYSIYYFLRCTLAINGIAIIRQKSLYYLKTNVGEMPVKKGHKDYNTDHSGTINHFIDLLGNSDILLSQNIDNTNAYKWLMDRREQINYRERSFQEPFHSDFWDTIATQIRKGNLAKILEDYIKDNFLLCFQEEHAVLAIPIKRAILTKALLDAEKIDVSITNEQKKLMDNLLPVKKAELLQLMQKPSKTLTV